MEKIRLSKKALKGEITAHDLVATFEHVRVSIH